MDLSNWNFKEDGIAFLNGKWSFYPEKLLGPKELSSAEAYLIKVPGSWATEKSYIQPLKGSGTYHLSIKLHPETGRMALKVQNIWMAHRLYINGLLVKEMGLPAKDYSNYKAKNTPYLIYIEPTNQLDIVLQVSNQTYYSGGIVHPILLGGDQSMEMKSYLSFGIEMAGFFLFLLFGIYHLQMYQMRDKDSTYLYSGIYMVLMSFVIITSGEKLFMRILYNIPFDIAYKLQDFCIFSSFIILVLFVQSLEPATVNKKTAAVVMLPVMIYLICVITTPCYFYINFKSYMSVYMNILMFALIFRLIYILLQKQDIKMPIGEFCTVVACVTFIAVTFLEALLYHSGYVNTNLIGKLSLLGFLISLNTLMARRFTNKMNEVQALSEELKKSNKIKDEFLARTSHEIKTPLHGIINISSHLMKEKEFNLTEKQRDNISLIQNTSMKLSLLVNDLIDVIKLRHEDLQLQTMTVDLYVIIQVVFQLLSFELEGKALRFVNRVKPMTFVEADENRLRQILYNITINAVKHTAKGEIVARANLEEGNVVLELSDTGTGIPVEQWELVFQDSYHGSLPDEYSHNGMGLGLYICRQLARKMNGEVWISDSIIGEGTTLSVRLPQGKLNHGCNVAEQAIVKRDDLNRHVPRPVEMHNLKKLLLVDDEPTNIRVLSLMLDEEFELFIAYQGEEALKLLQKHRIDLMIVDMMMPGMSGIELTQRIRKTHSVIKLPIIIATVRDSEKDIELAYQAGANDYITKPFTAQEIQSRVKVLLQLTDAMETALQNEIAFLQVQIKPHFIYNALSNIIALCHEDGERAAEMLSILSKYLRYIFQVDKVRHMLQLQQELDIIKAYVEIEKLRFGDRLRYDAYIDSGIEEIMMPALLIQPLIENAIRHGLFNKVGQGRVSLTITEGDEFIRIVVEDDGVGMSDDQVYHLMHRDTGKGVGVKNIRKRVESFPKASFLIDSELEKGTRCILFLPKETLKFPVKEGVDCSQ
ncbi:ATP-binding protein [Clostridium sp. BNL1100]|uniref:hybrid sensor histidine kinase/response regulator n=1 Tax=Clostridium sp. BNL1100 TaxID=755731 RepID=UPI000314B042|nr:ATP-binding protein [Clostridium sp. BNL1100]